MLPVFACIWLCGVGSVLCCVTPPNRVLWVSLAIAALLGVTAGSCQVLCCPAHDCAPAHAGFKDELLCKYGDAVGKVRAHQAGRAMCCLLYVSSSLTLSMLVVLDVPLWEGKVSLACLVFSSQPLFCFICLSPAASSVPLTCSHCTRTSRWG